MSSATTTSCEYFVSRRLDDEQLKLYDEQGYLVLKGVLTPCGLEQMRSEVMAAWEAEKGPFDPNQTWL